jgi:hypothetical protein
LSLAQRFNDVTCDITRISAFQIDQQYSIERADNLTTRYGETILQGIRDTTVDKLYKLFLPQRYVAVFKDDDLVSINDGIALWSLVPKGRCGTSNSYQLTIEQGSIPLIGLDHAA